LSNSLSTESCVEALEDAVEKYGIPEIINSDQGCQYTSDLWVRKIKKKGIKISMTANGLCNDNAYIERFWRTVKYEWLKLSWYNNERPHQSLNYLIPEEMICGFMERSYDLSNQDLEH
jgi:putative transposase